MTLQLHEVLHDGKFHNSANIESGTLSAIMYCVPVATFYGFSIEQTMKNFHRFLDSMYEWWQFGWRSATLTALNQRNLDMSFMVFMDDRRVSAARNDRGNGIGENDNGDDDTDSS